MVVVTDDGRWLELETSIARGGEGSIHPVVGDQSALAKVFTHPERRAEYRDDRLRWMMRTPAPRGDGWSCAWPTALILGPDDELVGFLMPYIADSVSMRIVGDPSPAAPDWILNARHSLALLLATAVAAIHDRGHLLCDISPENVLLRPDGSMVLIDVDAFDILADPGPPPVRYASTSWRAAYAPPEVTAKLGRLERLPHQDDYTLAICLFSLLMRGQHPFQGRGAPGQPAVSSTDAMREGWFPHVSIPGSPLQPSRGEPRFDALPAELQALFVQCFVTAHVDHAQRPTARSWATALANVSHRR